MAVITLVSAALQPSLGPTVAAVLALILVSTAGGVLLLLIRLERRREAELRTLAALAQAISGTPDDASEVAEAAFVHTARLLPADFFQLGVFQGEAYHTLIRIRDGDRVHNREFTLDDGREGLVGWIRRTAESLLVLDFRRTSSLPAAPSYASDDPPASGLFVPLKVENTVIGIVAVQSLKVNAFRRGRVVFANAGHNPPLVFTPGSEAQALPFGQTVLGVLPGVEYRETVVELPPGSMLLMYTDGVSDAAGPGGVGKSRGGLQRPPRSGG